MTLGVALLALTILASGCAAPARTAEPTVYAFGGYEETARDALWQSTQDVLRAHQFELDRVDERAGAITTYPSTSQHFFEFWREDVATEYDRLEATMRTVRRRVQVDFDEPATMTITVQRELFAAPDRQYNRSFAALRMFSYTLPAADTGMPITVADDYWIDDGRDPALERLLLDRIVARAGG